MSDAPMKRRKMRMMGETYVIGLYRMYGEDTVKDIVEDAMNRNHLTSKSLAAEAGIGDTTIRKWLEGDATIKYSTLEKILAALAEIEKGYD